MDKILFWINDEKLDELLHKHFSPGYEGDYYTLSELDWQKFQDVASSNTFDVGEDYDVAYDLSGKFVAEDDDSVFQEDKNKMLNNDKAKLRQYINLLTRRLEHLNSQKLGFDSEQEIGHIEGQESQLETVIEELEDLIKENKRSLKLLILSEDVSGL
ncbi:MAG: hypothetical protein WC460_06725 [Patescibacteria group bacterium]